MNEDLYNKIAKLSIDCFNSLPKTGKPTVNEWTILSCIIKQNSIKDNFEVVALGTGTKCIGKQKMSPIGDILNDSHAEVVCRRAFLHYLYQEINSCNSELFTFNSVSSKYCLNNYIVFHCFTSQVPCGDAAIFSEQDPSQFGEFLTCFVPKRLSNINLCVKIKQIKCQTGAKCLLRNNEEITNVDHFKYKVGVVRTKPGKGDPTLSLSCSDKIAKWCHVGLQGALLSLLVDKPIYLNTFTVAGKTPFCKEAGLRAFYDRFEIFTQNRMYLGQATDGFDYCQTALKQPCPSSISWCKINARALEVSVEGKKQGVTKKKQNTKSGRLQISKIELFRMFLNSVKEKQLNIFEDGVELNKIKYCDAKNKAVQYQEAWQTLKLNGFKEWTVKDEKLLQFCID